MKITTTTRWEGDRLAAEIEEKLNGSIRAGLDLLLERSNAKAPEKSGDLKRSGKVRADQGVVIYTSEYAVIQHERMDFHHRRGGAKFLEKAMIESAREIMAILADSVRGKV